MSEDRELKQRVIDELNWEPSVNAAHIGVTAKDGVITLIGHVETYAERFAAERAAKKVRDVKAVAEELEVKQPIEQRYSDEEITAAAIERLKWDAAIPDNAVKVEVEDGWVTLTGAVDWHYELESAADDIRGLRGVVGVSNEITIKSRVNADNIRDGIMTALHRSWFNPNMIKKINVTEKDGKVTLTGTVDYWADRDMAGTTAWAAAGVTSVDNDIRVD